MLANAKQTTAYNFMKMLLKSIKRVKFGYGFYIFQKENELTGVIFGR